MQERLQKLFAEAGYGSRRACEEFITAGRVRVNGQVATLGQKADLTIDKVTLDGNNSGLDGIRMILELHCTQIESKKQIAQAVKKIAWLPIPFANCVHCD
jgi:16S rRNA U516 pseudouridylate synthase RsuA-like enzyme